MTQWDDRYSTDTYIFGREPSHVLLEHASLFMPGQRVLSLADGEGRNGVYLATLGLEVHAVDSSSVGLAKAARLAADNRVEIDLEQADLFNWDWPKNAYDVVVSIMFHIGEEDLRARVFNGMQQALKPGGRVILHGFERKNADLGAIGPSDPAYLFTQRILRDGFAGMEIEELTEEERAEYIGADYVGQSFLITLVARKPV